MMSNSALNTTGRVPPSSHYYGYEKASHAGCQTLELRRKSIPRYVWIGCELSASLIRMNNFIMTLTSCILSNSYLHADIVSTNATEMFERFLYQEVAVVISVCF